MTPRTSELSRLVHSGKATDDQLLDYFGIDLFNQMMAQGDPKQEVRFAEWYSDVIAPMGFDYERSREMFYGRMNLQDYVDSFSAEEQRRFVREYPTLAAAHQARVDTGDIW